MPINSLTRRKYFQNSWDDKFTLIGIKENSPNMRIIIDWHRKFCTHFNLPFMMPEATAWLGFTYEGRLVAAVAEQLSNDRSQSTINALLAEPSRVGVAATYSFIKMYKDLLYNHEGPMKSLVMGIITKNKSARRKIETVFQVTEPFALVYLFDRSK